MKGVDCVFDENLRDVAVDPMAMRATCDDLQKKLLVEKDLDSKARTLGKLGSYQRILNNLSDAESCHIQCLNILKEINADQVRIIGAKIRLAHVYQWQKRFDLSNPLFLECLSLSESLSDGGEIKSFALQHQGKNLFDQKRYDEALKHFYDAMMIRVRLGKDDLADSSRIALDRVSSLIFSSPTTEQQHEILSEVNVPDFVRLVNGKKQNEISDGRPNCINAVFNFFSKPPYKYETAKTTDVLEFLRGDCTQTQEPLKKELGLVAVFWSRSGGVWDHRKITVNEMNTEDSSFPYGLVFEHIVVFVNAKTVFHKPSPAIEVPYRLEYFESAVGTLKYSDGFEITWHLKRSKHD